MKSLSQNKKSKLLSQYLDGVLSEHDQKLVGEMLSHDTGAAKELEDMRRIRDLLVGQKKIEPNPAFWTRLSAALDQHPDEENLLPFPRKYTPVAALGTIVGVLLIGLVVFQNRVSLYNFVNQKSQAVQSAYEEGFLKGTILPLLANIDNSQALEFSLSGILPLDKKHELALKVDQNAPNGYQIKLGKAGQHKSKPISVKEFCSEIAATQQQQQVIDSLVGIARRKIETSVLVGENKTVAIDPSLAQLNKEMVSNIAACLEPFQRVRFNRFLDKRNAPYSFVSKKFVPANPESIFVAMNRIPSAHQFIVFTPDTMTFAHVDAEMIRRARRSAEFSKQMKEVDQRNLELTEELLRRFANRRSQNLAEVPAPPFEVWKDANDVGIQIDRQVFGPGSEARHSVVVPMPRRLRTFTLSSPNAHVEISVFGDSVTAGEIAMDSAMTKFFNRNNLPEDNLRMMDSIFSSISLQFRTHPEALSFDSVFRSLEDARRRAFEEQKQHRLQLEKDVRYKKSAVPPER